MGHWRDHGVGNMAGSDDRMADEFTLMERLAVIAGRSKASIARFNERETAGEAFDALQEWHRDFYLYREAIIRGSLLWRAANPGNDFVAPDTAKLVAWLIELVGKADATQWRPVEEVEPNVRKNSYFPFRCLIQTENGYVYGATAGWASNGPRFYVDGRWQRDVKYWMAHPKPRID